MLHTSLIMMIAKVSALSSDPEQVSVDFQTDVLMLLYK